MAKEKNEKVKEDVENFFRKKDICLKILNEFEYSFIKNEDFSKELESLATTLPSEYRVIYNLLTKDNNKLRQYFSQAKISDNKVKILFEIKERYSNLSDAVIFYDYLIASGKKNKWTECKVNSFYDHTTKEPMIEFELKSINKSIFRTFDDATSLYRLGSLLQFIVRNELQEQTGENLKFGKKFIKELKEEIKRNTDDNKKLIKLIGKIETTK